MHKTNRNLLDVVVTAIVVVCSMSAVVVEVDFVNSNEVVILGTSVEPTTRITSTLNRYRASVWLYSKHF